ncbi:MAG: nucleotidyltransferase family protein [Blautia sp.]|jgi:molybdenum cofactor cytidylyltransferase
MKIRVIYLAAGFSRRFGENKLLYQWEGKALYRHLLDRWIALWMERQDIGEIVVVTRYPQIGEELADAPVRTIFNEHSHLGISSSLQAGLRTGGEEEMDAYLCSVADQPYLQKDTLAAFLDGYENSGKGIGVIECGGHLGNPVIFHKKYRDELLSLTGDRGGKQVVKAHRGDIWALKLRDSKELQDIDVK